VLAKCIRDLPDTQAAFTRFEEMRRPRVERIIKWAARVNNSKAAGPVGRVIRDAMMPVIMKFVANSRATNGIFDYHIDWDALSGAQA
jgi:2-polyprenyl-6-methoxyphenol hydroxylase-like FAD-dependent oxidoreductase